MTTQPRFTSFGARRSGALASWLEASLGVNRATPDHRARQRVTDTFSTGDGTIGAIMKQASPTEAATAATRYTLTSSSDAPPQVLEQYVSFLRKTGSCSVPHWLQCLGHSEPLTRGLAQHVQGVLLEGELPYILKELVIFIVSVTNGSHYCSAAHAHAVLSTNRSLRFADLVSLARDLDSVQLPPATIAAMKFAKKMAIDPNSVTDTDFVALSAAGIEGTQTTELIAVITLAIMFNNLSTVMQLPLDEEYLAVLPLPSPPDTSGYAR